MALRLDIELNTETLDLTVSDIGVKKGDAIAWHELTAVRDRIDRVLAQRERIENARRADRRRGAA